MNTSAVQLYKRGRPPWDFCYIMVVGNTLLHRTLLLRKEKGEEKSTLSDRITKTFSSQTALKQFAVGVHEELTKASFEPVDWEGLPMLLQPVVSSDYGWAVGREGMQTPS